MEALILFAICAGLIIGMARSGAGAHVAGHGHGQARGETGNAATRKLRGMPPERDTDPICGKSVRTDRAKPSVHNGDVYYFCSRDCREIFEAAPDIYLGGKDPSRSELGHTHA